MQRIRERNDRLLDAGGDEMDDDFLLQFRDRLGGSVDERPFRSRMRCM